MIKILPFLKKDFPLAAIALKILSGLPRSILTTRFATWGHFLVALDKKVTRPPGRDPAYKIFNAIVEKKE
jgi:hypothetical protein